MAALCEIPERTTGKRKERSERDWATVGAVGRKRTVVHGTSPMLKNLSYPLAMIRYRARPSVSSAFSSVTEKRPRARVGKGDGMS